MTHPPNGLTIGSAVFAQLFRVPNTQTDTQTTLHGTPVATCRIYALRECMRCGARKQLYRK